MFEVTLAPLVNVATTYTECFLTSTLLISTAYVSAFACAPSKVFTALSSTYTSYFVALSNLLNSMSNLPAATSCPFAGYVIALFFHSANAPVATDSFSSSCSESPVLGSSFTMSFSAFASSVGVTPTSSTVTPASFPPVK